MKNGLREEGYVKGVIYLLIIGLLVIVGMSFAMPYYRYYAFKTQAEGYMKIENATNKQIRDKIMKYVEELNVPVHETNLNITEYGSGDVLTASWFEEVNLFGLYQKRLDFYVEIED